MLSLLLIYFNKQNLRTRLLAGILVLAIISVISVATFARLFLYDPLAGFATKNTVFYLHLNLDNKGSYYQAKLIDTILNNFSLTDFDRHLLNDQLAVVCNQQQITNCYLIFFTNNKKATEKFLLDKEITYETARLNTVFVSQSSARFQPLKKSWSPLLYWRYHSGLLKDDLTLVINQIIKSQTFNQRLLAFVDPGIRLSGRINNQGIVLKPLSFTATKSDWQSEFIDINKTKFDLLLNLSDSIKIQPLLNNYLNSISNNNAGQSLEILLKNGFTLVMKKVNSSNELLTDYQIYLTSPVKVETKDTAQLQSTILEIGSKLLPVEKNIYLNDGTRVTLLNPNLGTNAQQGEQSYQLPINNGGIIFMNVSSSGLTLGNDLNFQPKTENISDNYGLIKISRLPNNNPLKDYLNEFSYLYFDDSKVIIR